MTAKQKGTALAILLAVLSALCAPLLGAAWNAKVDRSEFALHLEQERTHVVRDSARYEEIRALGLDTYCALRPSDRRCK